MDRFQLRKKEDEEEREEDSFRLPVSFPGEDQFKERKTQERSVYKKKTRKPKLQDMDYSCSLFQERQERNAPASHCLLLKIALHSLCVKK